MTEAAATGAPTRAIDNLPGFAVIGAMAFLTVVDLFATQAILPALSAHYAVQPGAMGVAVFLMFAGLNFFGAGLAYAFVVDGAKRRAMRPMASPSQPPSGENCLSA